MKHTRQDEILFGHFMDILHRDSILSNGMSTQRIVNAFMHAHWAVGVEDGKTFARASQAKVQKPPKQKREDFFKELGIAEEPKPAEAKDRD